MSTEHQFADAVKAWANGEPIQYRNKQILLHRCLAIQIMNGERNQKRKYAYA